MHLLVHSSGLFFLQRCPIFKFTHILGERPHPCPDCGKPFRVRSDMKRHRQTHMREQANANNTVGTPASTAVTQVGTQSPSPAPHAQVGWFLFVIAASIMCLHREVFRCIR